MSKNRLSAPLGQVKHHPCYCFMGARDGAEGCEQVNSEPAAAAAVLRSGEAPAYLQRLQRVAGPREQNGSCRDGQLLPAPSQGSPLCHKSGFFGRSPPDVGPVPTFFGGERGGAAVLPRPALCLEVTLRTHQAKRSTMWLHIQLGSGTAGQAPMARGEVYFLPLQQEGGEMLRAPSPVRK